MQVFRRSIPKGYQIYASFDVAGLHVDSRLEDVQRFLAASDPEVSFEREPENPHDQNAIRVTGSFGSGGIDRQRDAAKRNTVVLGYIPRKVAEILIVTGVLPLIVPRLYTASSPNETWVSIALDALGPKEEATRARYFDYLRMQQDSAPASERDRLFIQVCGKKLKKGITNCEAEQQVRELRQQLVGGVPRRLEEVESLVSVIDSLLDEFADAENVKDYEMRKVPPSVVVAAVVQLADRGISAAEIEDDFDLVVAEILKLRPSLARS